MGLTFLRKEFNDVPRKVREVSGFSLVEFNYPPNVEIPAHAHEQANFCMAIEGGCVELYGSKVREYKPFTLDFLPPHQTHSLKTSTGGMRAFSIDIAPQWLWRMRECSLNVEDSVHCRDDALIQLLIKLYHEFQNLDEASPLSVEGLAMEMLAEVSRSRIRELSPPSWLRKARDIIRQQFSLDLSLEEIAREVRVHPVSLARGFRKHYHCTAGEYVRSVRIGYACREMIAAKTPLAEIASAAGFSDQSHFTRTFKRLKGMTPAEYRAKFDLG